MDSLLFIYYYYISYCFLDGFSPCVKKENLCSIWKALYVRETETRDRERKREDLL